MDKYGIPWAWWLPAIGAFAVFFGLLMRIGASGAERVSERQHRIMWLALATGLAYVAFVHFYFETDSLTLNHPWHAAFWGVNAALVAVAALGPSPQRIINDDHLKGDHQGEHKK